MGMKYDKETMLEVINLMFDNISWPIWKEKIDKIKEECDAEFEKREARGRENRIVPPKIQFISALNPSSENTDAQAVDKLETMFDKVLGLTMTSAQRHLIEQYWSQKKGEFIQLVDEMYVNYRTKVYIEDNPEGGITINFDNYRVEKDKEIKPAKVHLPSQAAALYSAILKLGYFDIRRIQDYYASKVTTNPDPIPEVETVKQYYIKATEKSKKKTDPNYTITPNIEKQIDERVERILTTSFDTLCSNINSTIKAQLKDDNNTLNPELTEKIYQDIIIQAQLNGIKTVRIDRRLVIDRT